MVDLAYWTRRLRCRKNANSSKFDIAVIFKYYSTLKYAFFLLYSTSFNRSSPIFLTGTWARTQAPTEARAPDCWSLSTAGGTLAPCRCWWWSCRTGDRTCPPSLAPSLLCLLGHPPKQKMLVKLLLQYWFMKMIKEVMKLGKIISLPLCTIVNLNHTIRWFKKVCFSVSKSIVKLVSFAKQ